jgi:hypothetical protein
MKYRRLYPSLFSKLSQQLPHATRPQVRNLAMITWSLAQSSNCHLATLAKHLPVPGQRENLIQRVRRWLDNQTVTQACCYMPLVHQLFRTWPGVELCLVMDRTDLEDRWSVLLLGAAFRHRVLPLAWRVLPFGSTDTETQLALLKQVRPALPDPKQVQTTFYGDCEFRAIKLQRYCQAQNWHWHLGLKSDLLFRQETEAWRALRTIPVQQGQRHYLSQVLFTQQHAFGPVNLIADWTTNEDAPRYVVTDQPADRHTWRRGRKRFWIEPTFRDWKSYGFDLERSNLLHPTRIQTLLLALAVTTLWMIHIGYWVDINGRRYLLEASHKRDYSIFRLGRDYLDRARSQDWSVPVGFSVH